MSQKLPNPPPTEPRPAPPPAPPKRALPHIPQPEREHKPMLGGEGIGLAVYIGLCVFLIAREWVKP